MTEEIINGIRKRFITHEEHQNLIAFESMRFFPTLISFQDRLKERGIEYWLLNPDGSKPKEAY